MIRSRALLRQLRRSQSQVSDVSNLNVPAAGDQEQGWLKAWLRRHDGISEIVVNDLCFGGDSPEARTLVFILEQPCCILSAVSLAMLSGASNFWRKYVHRCAISVACKAYNAPLHLPLRSLFLLQRAVVYENFDDSEDQCWRRWDRWGDMAEDEPYRVLGGGAARLRLTRLHRDTFDHFGRGVRMRLSPVNPRELWFRMCVERLEFDSFNGGAVGYVIAGDSTPVHSSGSRFGHEAVFLFFTTAKCDDSGPRLQLCEGRSTSLMADLGVARYGRWFQVMLAFDWELQRVSVCVDGHKIGNVSFRQPDCIVIENLTLLNLGGPAAVRWSEIALI